MLFCLCRDLVAIIAALEHNHWFTKLSTKDYKLVTPDLFNQIEIYVDRKGKVIKLGEKCDPFGSH